MAKAKQEAAAAPEVENEETGATFSEGGDDVQMIDFSQVNENSGDFEVLPRGIYDVVVDDLVYGISQRSGNPMWTWTFQVTTPEYENRKLFFHTVLTPEQLGRTKKVLSCIAPELLTSPINPQTVADEGILLGKAARVRVDIRKYEGEDRNNVRAVMPPTADQAGGGSNFL